MILKYIHLQVTVVLLYQRVGNSTGSEKVDYLVVGGGGGTTGDRGGVGGGGLDRYSNVCCDLLFSPLNMAGLQFQYKLIQLR